MFFCTIFLLKFLFWACKVHKNIENYFSNKKVNHDIFIGCIIFKLWPWNCQKWPFLVIFNDFRHLLANISHWVICNGSMTLYISNLKLNTLQKNSSCLPICFGIGKLSAGKYVTWVTGNVSNRCLVWFLKNVESGEFFNTLHLCTSW